MHRKSSITVFVLIGTLFEIILLSFFCYMYSDAGAYRAVVLSGGEVPVSQTLDNPCNAYQANFSSCPMAVGTFNNTLYIATDHFIYDDPQYNGALLEFKESGPEVIATFPEEYSPLTILNGYLYCVDGIYSTEQPDVLAYEISTGKETYLDFDDEITKSISAFAIDSTLYYSPVSSRNVWYPITGTDVGQPVNGYPDTVEEIRYDAAAGYIPCEEGVLYGLNSGRTLEIILIKKDTSERVTLYTSEADYLHKWTYTVHDGYLYVSCERLWYDTFYLGPMTYSNTELDGTFRISLSNGSSEKISDTYYTKLYVFDDTGLYGITENCSVQKIGFDGSCEADIISVRASFKDECLTYMRKSIFVIGPALSYCLSYT